MTTATGEQTADTGWTAGPDTFGARLALVRQRMGWNIKEAARECGLGAESWRLWEQGREPQRRITIAMAIATRTGCDYLWLVHGPGRGQSGTLSIALSDDPWQGQRVVAIGGRERPHPNRPVRQTRPIIGAGRRPVTPVPA